MVLNHLANVKLYIVFSCVISILHSTIKLLQITRVTYCSSTYRTLKTLLFI